MSFCENCGNKLNEDEKICTNCGYANENSKDSETEPLAVSEPLINEQASSTEPEDEGTDGEALTLQKTKSENEGEVNAPRTSQGDTASAEPHGERAEPHSENPEPYTENAETAAQNSDAASLCTNCGARLSADDGFCINCGEKVIGMVPGNSAFITKAMPKFALKKWIVAVIGVIAAAAVICLALLLFKSPSQKFVQYQQDFFINGYVGFGATLAERANALYAISSDLVFTAESDREDIMEYLKDSKVDLKLDVQKKAITANAEIDVMGSNVLNVLLHYNDGKVFFSLPDADERQFTYDIDKVNENTLKNGTSYKDMELFQFPVSSFKKLGSKYTNILLSMVNSDNVTVTKKDEIRLKQLEKTVEGTVYVCRPTAEDIEKMMLKLADEIENDNEIKSIIGELPENRTDIFSSYQNSDGELDELVDEILFSAAEDIRNSVSYMSNGLEDSGFTWTLGISNGRICLQEISIDNGGSLFSYESAGDESQKRTDVFNYHGNDNDDIGLKITWSLNDKLYSGKINFTENDYDVLTVDFSDVNLNKLSAVQIPHGTYEFKIDPFDITFEAVYADGGGTNHILTIKNAEDIYILSEFGSVLKLNLFTSDKPSTAIKPSGNAVDISEYDDLELYELFQELMESVQNIMQENTLGILQT